MIAVIADDFSGAAELAGIAAARGLKAEVQTRFEPRSEADVIAVDTETRLKTEDEAAGIVSALTHRIMNARPEWIYKKTDSVMRGHIRAEIEAMLDATGQRECLFIPANPSKGRTIVEGHYFVGGVPLHETVFASDPDYPRTSSCVRKLLGESHRIRMPDACRVDDLDSHRDRAALSAGAVDFFGALLGGANVAPRIEETEGVLLLCGSLAAWDTGRAEEMTKRGFSIHTIEEAVSPAIWRQESKVMLAIGRPAHVQSSALIDRLVETAFPLIENRNDLRIGLEGGATATAFIRRMGWTRFGVIAEGHVGVGSLRPPGGPLLCVKPGSYPWPDTCLD